MYQLIYILFFSLVSLPDDITFRSSNKGKEVCVNQEERDLYALINTYRQQNGLKAIPFSASLTKVAQVHARDLMKYYQRGTDCNPHSWSENGQWTACCYTNDHKEARCMWDKPMEISGYAGAGYEIVYWHSAAAMAHKALEGWKNSPNHNQIIMNANMWEEATWNAMGVGIHQQYAVVWFGQEKDPAGQPGTCN